MNRNSITQHIYELGQEQKTGNLFLAQDRRSIRVHFEAGLIQQVSSNLQEHQLGDYFKAAKLISVKDLARLLKKASQKKQSVGALAVELEILHPSSLAEILREQALDLLQLAIAEGFEIEALDETRTQSQTVEARLSFWEVMLHLARNYSENHPLNSNNYVSIRQRNDEPASPSHFRKSSGLESLSDEIRLMLRTNTESENGDLSYIPWSPEELSVLCLLDRPMLLEELHSRTGLSEDKMAEVLGTLTWLGVCTVNTETSDLTSVEVKLPSLESLIPQQPGAKLSERLEVVHIPGSFVAEQFNSLKVRLEGLKTEKPLQTLAVVSAHMQDGKSLTSTNLAFCYAKDPGSRVVVVDCDLRSPSLQSYLGIPLGPGLADYLRGDPLAPYCYLRRVGDLYLMTAGGPVDNPVELLSHPRMKELSEFLRNYFDLIILDCPPLQPISDTGRLTRFADGILMVIRRGKTPYASVERSLRFLEGDKLLGVVFNDVEPQLFNTYYYHQYYGYGQRKTYPYAPSNKKRKRR